MNAAVVTAILDEIHPGHALTDDTLRKLHHVFRNVSGAALQLVDGRAVRRFTTSPAGRTCYAVDASSRGTAVYHCFGGYCSCPAFLYSVVQRRESPLCKHQLAAALAVRLGTVIDVEIADAEWAERVLDVRGHED